MINLQDIKDFVEAELKISSKGEYNKAIFLPHRENGKTIFGEDLAIVVDLINNSIPKPWEIELSVLEKQIDYLATILARHLNKKNT